MPMDEQAPPGWYPVDDGASERYWDGAAWTGDSRPKPEDQARGGSRGALLPVQRVREWHRGLPSSAQAAVTLGAVIIVLAAFAGSRAAWSSWREPDRAIDACEGYVSDGLKAPSTAEFGEASVRKEAGGDVYAVTGTVDSQNGFGAMIRNRYECRVAPVGDGFFLRTVTFNE